MGNGNHIEHLSILHLSDLHMGEDTDRPNRFYKTPTLIGDAISKAVRSSPAQCQKAVRNLSLVLITGDLGLKGVVNSDRIVKAIAYLPTALELPKDQELTFLVIPGNHDKNLAAKPDEKAVDFHALREPLKQCLREEKGYTRAEVAFPDENSAYTYAWGVDQEKPRAILLALDSAANLTADNQRGRLTDNMWGMLAPAAGHARIKLAALHHNLIDFPYPYGEPQGKDRCLSESYRLLEELCSNGYSIVLHGHQHTAFPFRGRAFYPSAANMSPVYILPCGCWYESQPGPGTFRHFQLLSARFSPDADALRLQVFAFCDWSCSGSYAFDDRLSVNDVIYLDGNLGAAPQERVQGLCVSLAKCPDNLTADMVMGGLDWTLDMAESKYMELVDAGSTEGESQHMYSFYYQHLFNQARGGDRCFAAHHGGAGTWIDENTVESLSLDQQRIAVDNGAAITRVVILDSRDVGSLKAEDIVRLTYRFASRKIGAQIVCEATSVQQYLSEHATAEVSVGRDKHKACIDPGNIMLYERGQEAIGFFFVGGKRANEQGDANGRIAVVTRDKTHIGVLRGLRDSLQSAVSCYRA